MRQLSKDLHLDQMMTNLALNQTFFFCGQPAMAGNKRKSFDLISVKTIELKETVLTVCHERNNSWEHSYWHECKSS